MRINKFVLYFGLACINPTVFLPGGVSAADSQKSKSDSLFEAVKNKDAEALSKLIGGDSNINEFKDEDGNTLLIYAAAIGNLKTVKLLVEHGADIRAENKNGQTPLMLAISSGIPALIAKTPNIPPFKKTTGEYTAGNSGLIAAIRQNGESKIAEDVLKYYDVVDYLLQQKGIISAKADGIGRTAFTYAVQQTDGGKMAKLLFYAVRKALNDGELTKRQFNELINKCSSAETLLYYAAFKKRQTAVSILIDAGAALKAPSSYDDNEENPILGAVKENDMEAIGYLLEAAGNSPKHRKKFSLKSGGKSPISAAAENGNTDMLLFLIKNGIGEAPEIRSVLDSAVESGDSAAVKMLVEGIRNSEIADSVFEYGVDNYSSGKSIRGKIKLFFQAAGVQNEEIMSWVFANLIANDSDTLDTALDDALFLDDPRPISALMEQVEKYGDDLKILQRCFKCLGYERGNSRAGISGNRLGWALNAGHLDNVKILLDKTDFLFNRLKSREDKARAAAAIAKVINFPCGRDEETALRLAMKPHRKQDSLALVKSLMKLALSLSEADAGYALDIIGAANNEGKYPLTDYKMKWDTKAAPGTEKIKKQTPEKIEAIISCLQQVYEKDKQRTADAFNSANKEGLPPIWKAITDKNGKVLLELLKFVKYLSEKKEDPAVQKHISEILETKCKMFDIAVDELKKEKGLRAVKARSQIKIINSVRNLTPLQAVIANIKLEDNTWSDAAKIMAEAGADVDVTDLYGQTPLHFAAALGKPDLLSAFLSHAREQLNDEKFAEFLDKRDSNGQTALYAAAKKAGQHTKRIDHNILEKFKEVISILVEFGADINIKSKHGKSPLYWNSVNGNTEMVKFLMSLGAKADWRTKAGVGFKKITDSGMREISDILKGKPSGNTEAQPSPETRAEVRISTED